MLHEILLSLSGYQSEIFDKARGQVEDGSGVNEFTSEPERAMLEVLGRIAELHIDIKQTAARIASNHPSPICSGAAARILDTHLTAFRKKVVQVESLILQRDAGLVGGYGIVPLSTLAGEFKPWLRRMQWLRSVAQRALRQGEEDAISPCSGKQMLDFLQSEAHTGHSDIEEMAIDILNAAQRVWMRSVASWVLYGKLPDFGRDDFLIQHQPSRTGNTDVNEYILEPTLRPRFVNESTGEIILAIGTAINQIRAQTGTALKASSAPIPGPIALLPKHLKILEALHYPLNTWILQQAMDEIDVSISQNALAYILPLNQVVDLLEVVHRYMLLSEGEFATGLIEHAAEKLRSRQTVQAAKPVRKVGRVDDLSIKEAELSTILARTWDELAAIQNQYTSDNQVFAAARSLLVLRAVKDSHLERVPLSTLMPTAAVLEIDLPPDSNMRLFLRAQDVETYAGITAFLLSIRRTELHLSQLWKLTSQRRCHPTPIGPPVSASDYGQKALSVRRLREARRSTAMRQHWSSTSKTLYVLNELAAYFHSEVIHNNWESFQHWLHEGSARSRPGSSRSHGSRPGTSSSAKTQPSSTRPRQMNDPRTLARGHRVFLDALHSGLMLKNKGFIAVLKEVLNTVDHYVALFSRLSTIWQGLDLQEDEGIVDAFTNYNEEERAVLTEMIRCRTSLEELITSLVDRLKEAEHNRTSDSLVDEIEVFEIASHSFVPWKERTLDRLIMKLDYLAGASRRADEEEKLVDDFDD